MKDFNGNELKVGDTIFWCHKMSQQVIGRISYTKGKTEIYVNEDDIIKCTKAMQNYFDLCRESNSKIEGYKTTLWVASRKVIKI